MNVAEEQWIHSEQPIRWLFYGDSITQGALHTFGYRDYTEIFSERVRFEVRRSYDCVINTAISGHTSRELVAGFDTRVAPFQPDVIFLMVGMNDAAPDNAVDLNEFRTNLQKLIQAAHAFKAQMVLQTSCTILEAGSGGRFQPLPDYMAVVRALAHEHRLMLVDHHRDWEALGDRLPYLLSDAIHPNEMGHRMMAQTLFRSLNLLDPTSVCCRLFTP